MQRMHREGLRFKRATYSPVPYRKQEDPMRILSNCSKWIVCFFLALFTMTGGDVALSQGRKGMSATRSIREWVTRYMKAAVAQQERAAVDDAVQFPSQGPPRLRQTSGPEGGVILTLFS